MRVNYLYIIGIDPDDETSAVCDGLYTKYAGRSGPTGLIRRVPGETQVFKSTGDIPLNSGIKHAPSYIKTQLPTPPVPAKSNVGVYLVLHSVGHDRDNSRAAVLPELLTEVIPEDQRSQVNKIALLQCYSASHKHRELNEQPIQDIANAPPLITLLSALRAKGMTPMLAGWDGYVSAAPHRPEGGQLITKPDNNPKTPWQVVQDPQTIAGRKIVHYRKETTVPLPRHIEATKSITTRSTERVGCWWIARVGPTSLRLSPTP